MTVNGFSTAYHDNGNTAGDNTDCLYLTEFFFKKNFSGNGR